MNIKELLEWRNDCFYCGSELDIFPSMNGCTGSYCIKDDWLIAESRFINFSINIINGEFVKPEKYTGDLADFVNRGFFKIVKRCSDCYHDGRIYSYSGWIVWLESKMTHVINIEEIVENNNYILIQDLEKETAALSLPAPKSFDFLPSSFKLPFFDLKKINNKQLENKIKTYAVFS